MAALMADLINGTLVSTPTLTEDLRQSFRSKDVIGQIRSNRRLWLTDSPDLAGYWLVQIMVTDREMQNWLQNRLRSKESSSEANQSPTAISAGSRTNKAKSAEEECGQWIAKLTERPASKDHAFTQAKVAVEATGPLSRKAFERAWADNAPLHWKRAGRRRTH
jgi:hypothetical protein